jgi:hypothetical protein
VSALTLFHEVPEHDEGAQGHPNHVQHEERDHEPPGQRRGVLREAGVEQGEQHELGEEGQQPPDRAPDSQQRERREWGEDPPEDHRARRDEAPQRGLEEGRQQQECDELRGAEHVEAPRPRQDDEPGHCDQLVQGRDRRRHRVAIKGVGDHPDTGEQSDQERRERQCPVAKSLIVGLLWPGAEIRRSLEQSHDELPDTAYRLH